MFDHPMKPLSSEFVMELCLKELKEIERWTLLEEKEIEKRDERRRKIREEQEELIRINIEARMERDRLAREEKIREEKIKELEVEIEVEEEIKNDIEQRIIKQKTVKQKVSRQRIYKFFDTEFETDCCAYCGEIATTTDHFIPKAFRNAIDDLGIVNNRLLIPACKECNSTAGAQIFNSIKEKREFIHFCYKRKYRNLLESEDWTEKELNELGHTLRSRIKASQQAKKIIKRRLKWPKRL